MTQGTLFDLFEKAAARAANAAALKIAGQTISYSLMHERVQRLADCLLSRLERTGAIAILARDAQTLLESFLACAAIGRPAMPLDPELPAPSVDALLTRHEFAALIAGDMPLRVGGDLPVIAAQDCVDGPAQAARPMVDGGTEFYWGLTSGTTGEPKLFARPHASWIASFEAAERVFVFPPHSQILIPGPLYHSLFLYGAVHALCRGHTVILLDGQYRPNRLAEAAAQATHFYAVPFMLNEMLKARVTAPNLKIILSGGAKLSAELRSASQKAWPGIDLAEFYGASETSFVSFYSTTRPASAGSVGRAFPSVAIEIRDTAGKPLETRQDGEIFVSSPMLFSRYVGEKAPDKWCSVGDMGFLDDAGCLHLTGRTTRIINSRGLKIHPEVIEAALLALPQVERVAVVGLPDAVRDTIAVATIEFAGGGTLTRGALSAYCRETLGAKHCPRQFFVTDCLPLTRSGKIAITKLQEALLSGKASYRELR